MSSSGSSRDRGKKMAEMSGENSAMKDLRSVRLAGVAKWYSFHILRSATMPSLERL